MAVTATAQLAKRQLTWLRREREMTLRQRRICRSIVETARRANFCCLSRMTVCDSEVLELFTM